ncbi:MAG: glycine cleavage system protein GcvH [Planctomycetes bacterium]|nr:glycine cleavage system protein GcvH [Planctomycetota bacterium]MCH9728028.1 glycine cleavage system protein GcvH [Planctomycetota bacterium]MCH9775830.1 glycine cleavage system protein GcvH [Planctomycetota bacterium]MCH9791092.1 glycine cleavage system protein GcvH [Planctomycetota bacterium]MDF1744666.1 glycine cleavage system protein GcvH [Gimesia sp.]
MDQGNLKFTKTHEWVNVEGDTVTVGITDFAVNQLTDLVYIELPTVGSTCEAGKVFGEVESVKAVSDLYSPVSGEITEVNSALVDDQSPLSDDPFGSGWITKVKMSNTSELDQFMNADEYRKFCESEAH